MENNVDMEELATSATAEVTETKPAKDRKSRKEKNKPFEKIVVRRLPPSMTEEEFLKQIDPVPQHDYFYFVPADFSLGLNATCRAYINFCQQSDIYIFRDKFDGYVFVDSKGSEYAAIVEFAPFQGLPKVKSRKKDLKANTITTEAHYLTFLESLKDEETDGKAELKMEYSFKIKDDQKITSTPLLEYLANVRQERRDERKKKIDDKKRMREEEKQRKKNQTAKSIPRTIDENIVQDGNQGMRANKSRTLDREKDKTNQSSDNSKANKTKDSDGVGQQRTRRERKRTRERQSRRKEGQDSSKKEKENQKEPVKSTKNDGISAKDDKEKRKKNIENHRDRGHQQDSLDDAVPLETHSSSKSDSKNTKKKIVDDTIDVAGDVSQKKSYSDLSSKERSVTNLKNKDRPSLQIYQPGKRRSSSSQSLNSENVGDELSPSNEKPERDTFDKAPSKPRTRGMDSKNQKESSTNKNRISRYSEKRHKAKEKRETMDNANNEKGSDYNEDA